jgi:hypothetical protein
MILKNQSPVEVPIASGELEILILSRGYLGTNSGG